MGFWSSVGSFVSSAVSSVARTVSSAASSVYNTAKNIAGKAIDWIADKAEGFVDGVKKVWSAVKPYVEHIRTAIRAAALVVPIPWLKGALLMLDTGLGALTAFENSPIAKKVRDAIDWAIKLAKRWKWEKELDQQHRRDRLEVQELTEAKQHQENLRFAEREIVDESQRHQLELAAAINDYEIANTELANTIEKGVNEYDHYLRLRAVQKLLKLIDGKFRSAKTVDELSADDLFLVRIASDLIKDNPELKTEAAQRLDRILTSVYGKALQPFIFEELTAAWGKRVKALGTEWAEKNKSYAKDSMLYKRLEIAKKVQGELSVEEALQLDILKMELPKQKQLLDGLATKQRDLDRYVGATEGFLQLLEKSEEQIEKEDRSYLLDEGATVGKLLIECAQNDTPFSNLSEEDRELLTDYSNIFKEESKTRTKTLLEVTV